MRSSYAAPARVGQIAGRRAIEPARSPRASAGVESADAATAGPAEQRFEALPGLGAAAAREFALRHVADALGATPGRLMLFASNPSGPRWPRRRPYARERRILLRPRRAGQPVPGRCDRHGHPSARHAGRDLFRRAGRDAHRADAAASDGPGHRAAGRERRHRLTRIPRLRDLLRILHRFRVAVERPDARQAHARDSRRARRRLSGRLHGRVDPQFGSRGRPHDRRLHHFGRQRAGLPRRTSASATSRPPRSSCATDRRTVGAAYRERGSPKNLRTPRPPT